MSEFLINQKNLSFLLFSETIEEYITSICNPLKYLNINYFGYLRFYKDGTYLKLSNNLLWTKFYIINNLADKSSAFAETIVDFPLSKLKIQLWPNSKGNDCLSSLYEHDIWNGINCSIKHEDFIEIYYFATKRENIQILDLYINNLELLIKFNTYFYDKITKIVNFKDKKNLAMQENQIPFFMEANSKVETPNSALQSVDVESFSQKIGPSYYYISDEYSHIRLTKRELECLHYLSHGRTAKEIGKITKLSFRTIEDYINNLKLKTGVNTRSQLIDIYLDNLTIMEKTSYPKNKIVKR